MTGRDGVILQNLPSLRGFESDEKAKANIELITAAFNACPSDLDRMHRRSL